jgi:hypothetical protein
MLWSREFAQVLIVQYAFFYLEVNKQFIFAWLEDFTRSQSKGRITYFKSELFFQASCNIGLAESVVDSQTNR